MLQLVATSGNFVAVTLGLPDKTALSTAHLPDGYDPTARPWYKQAVDAGHPLVTGTYLDAGTGKPTFSFVAPAMRDGTFKGAIAAGVLLEGVSNIVSVIHPTPSSFAFLVDQDGKLLAASNTSLLLKPATELAPALTHDMLASLQAATAPVAVDIDGTTKLLRSQPIAGTDWSLVLALDKSDVTRGMHAIATTSLIAIIVVSLLAAAVVGALTNVAFQRILLVRDALNDVASGSGDLSKQLPVTGKDEASEIAHAFNLFAKKLSAILVQIRESSESVSVASAQIAQGNQDLSSRTEEQAASLEQTAASMEELSSTVKQNSNNAIEASRLASSASDVAQRGGAAVSAVVDTMKDISTDSSRISEIVSLIDGIAFQTNILALNAAVEAARAGEQGRGFAVVAGEVRTLAQRSAQAAKEIKQLIEESAGKVEIGARQVESASTAMEEIVRAVQHVTSIVSEISSASEQQASGIDEVNRAVSQMDQVTQQNAALVEEAAAAASSLQDQADGLARSVSAFKLSV
jgi:methyl-accepting chemotaxis protein